MIGFSSRLGEVKEYYFSTKLKEIQLLREQGKDIINLGIGSPDLPPDPTVIAALHQTASLKDSHGYQSYVGTPSLRTAFADYYSKVYGVTLNPSSDILPLMGSKEGIMHISLAFLDEGDEVLIPNPGYPTYTSVTKLVKAKPIYYELHEHLDWAPDFRAMEKLNLEKVKLMWVNYPHMPTGAPGSSQIFSQLIAFAKAHQLLLVNDNPYSQILYPEPMSILAQPSAMDYAMELNSLSKSFNIPGWRVGMLAGNSTYIQAVLRVKSNMDSGMFLGLQEGAKAALALGSEWVEKNNLIYEGRRELVWKLAEKIGLEIKKQPGGLFVWAKVQRGVSAKKLVDELLFQKGVFVTPGFIFGSQGEEFIRFSLCIDTGRILEAIERI
ncbi:pyridoxal phosphate-dependent aminotransferase [Pleomorphovibrio marinus]|uniref:pyridoxal phosphate-dependent aminotransferase n=1 Tax=Pleomorphovibrio marinus TaxID=2164132 RepID=UPI000E0A4275|nr:aminotransferase class I/II-fold pyridoxal phosphate-dependent enzyme [Pleomorphovibrio marinus]